MIYVRSKVVVLKEPLRILVGVLMREFSLIYVVYLLIEYKNVFLHVTFCTYML